MRRAGKKSFAMHVTKTNAHGNDTFKWASPRSGSILVPRGTYCGVSDATT